MAGFHRNKNSNLGLKNWSGRTLTPGSVMLAIGPPQSTRTPSNLRFNRMLEMVNFEVVHKITQKSKDFDAFSKSELSTTPKYS